MCQPFKADGPKGETCVGVGGVIPSYPSLGACIQARDLFQGAQLYLPLFMECIMNIHYVNFNPYYNSQMFKNDSYLSMTVCHYVSQQERKRIKTIFKVFSSKALKVARFSREKLKKVLCARLLNSGISS